MRRVVCASPNYLVRHDTPLTPEDLAHHACVTFTGLGNPDRWTFSEQGTDKVVAIRSRLAVNTADH